MMRRSFQLSGSYDVIKDITDLESKCPFIFSQNFKSNILNFRGYVWFSQLKYTESSSVVLLALYKQCDIWMNFSFVSYLVTWAGKLIGIVLTVKLIWSTIARDFTAIFVSRNLLFTFNCEWELSGILKFWMPEVYNFDWTDWVFFLLFWAISIKIIYFMSSFSAIFFNLPFIVSTIHDIRSMIRFWWYVPNARVTSSILCQIWFYTFKIMWQCHVFECLKASQSLFPQSSKAQFYNFW